jgi:3-hydroxybutyrate dehydrogenase
MLRGKAALITGSTSGIGLEVLKTLAAAGCDVAMHGYGDAAVLKETCGRIKSANEVDVAYSSADLRQPAQIRDMVKSVQVDTGPPAPPPCTAATALESSTCCTRYVQEQFGRLDILVNNAGIQFVSPVEEFPEDKWDDIIAVCLSSAFHATKAAVPMMDEQGWGRIINTGGWVAMP